MNQTKTRTISALVMIAIAGAAVAATARSSHAEPAADDCLSQPSGAPPQGSHWYYRTDRSTNQRCWYLKAKEAKEAKEVARPKPQPSSKPISEPKAEPPAEPVVRTATPVPYVPLSLQSLPAPAAAIEPEPTPAAAIEPEPAPSIDQQPATPPQREAGEQNDQPSMEAVASADDPGAAATSGLRLGPMLALVAAALALAAVIVRKVFKLFTVRRLRRRRSVLRSDWEAAGATPVPVASAFADMVAVHHADLDPDATRLADFAGMPAASRNLSRAIAERDIEIGDIEATLQRLVHDLRRVAA